MEGGGRERDEDREKRSTVDSCSSEGSLERLFWASKTQHEEEREKERNGRRERQ